MADRTEAIDALKISLEKERRRANGAEKALDQALKCSEHEQQVNLKLVEENKRLEAQLTLAYERIPQPVVDAYHHVHSACAARKIAISAKRLAMLAEQINGLDLTIDHPGREWAFYKDTPKRSYELPSAFAYPTMPEMFSLHAMAWVDYRSGKGWRREVAAVGIEVGPFIVLPGRIARHVDLD